MQKLAERQALEAAVAGRAAAQACGALARARAAYPGGAWGHEPGLAPGAAAALGTPRVGLSPRGAAELTELWPMQLDAGAHPVSAPPHAPLGTLGRQPCLWEPTRRRRLLPSSCESPSLHFISALALQCCLAPHMAPFVRLPSSYACSRTHIEGYGVRAAGSHIRMAAEQQRVNRIPSSYTHTERYLSALDAPEATPRQHSRHFSPYVGHSGHAYPAGTEMLFGPTPRQQGAGAAPCGAGVGGTAYAGDLPRPLFPCSWHRGQDPGLSGGRSTGLGAAQQPEQPVLFCTPPLLLPSRPRCDSRTLFPASGPGSDPDPAHVEGYNIHAVRALVVAGGASEAPDAAAIAWSVSHPLHTTERSSQQESADLELCALLNPAPSARHAQSAPLRPASAPSRGRPRAACSDDEHGAVPCGAQALASLEHTDRADGQHVHAQAATADAMNPGTGAGSYAGDRFASGEHAEAVAQRAPDADPAPDPCPAEPDARFATAQIVAPAAPCAPAANPSQGLNPSQQGALDALVAQLVAQPALLRQLLARLLLSASACAQLGQPGPAPQEEHFQECVGALVPPGLAVPAHETKKHSLPAQAEPAHKDTGSPQHGEACYAPGEMLVAEEARTDAPDTGAAGAAKQSSACGAGGGSLHGAPAAGPGSPRRARSHERGSGCTAPAAARGMRASRAVHMTQIHKHPIIDPKPDRPSSPQRGARAAGTRPHSASAARSRAPERLRPAQEFSFAPAPVHMDTDGEAPGVAGSSPERGPALDAAGPAETPARGVTSPVDSWLAESSVEAAPDPIRGSRAGLPRELGSLKSEHGDPQASADTACDQAASGAAHVCQALPAGNAALLVSLQQPSAQGLGSGQGSLYAQPRAWDDQWQAGDDGALPCGDLAPNLASGTGSERGAVDGLKARQLGEDKEHASLPAMHAALAQSDSAGSPAADAAAHSLAAGTAEHASQLSKDASNAGAGAPPMDSADQQHEPDTSTATRSCGLADACISEETLPLAIFDVGAAAVLKPQP